MRTHPYYIILLLCHCVALLLAIPTCSLAQETPVNTRRMVVKGKIIDEQGNAVIATIKVKGTGIATGTNSKGEFELKNTEGNVTLIISGVSIESHEIAVDRRTDIGIVTVRSKFTESKEVIVEANTGYQKLAPNEINGSIVVIDNKTLNQQTGTNILKRLDGVTSGLSFTNKTNPNPESGLNIAIRGASTINGPLNPVIVLDNFIYEGNISNINPNDIESISVLKDAAATSIYGAKGGNGVIVITTKKGKFNQPARVEVSSTVIASGKPDVFYLSQISSADYIDVEQFLYRNGFYTSQVNFAWYYRKPFSPTIQIFTDRQNGLISTVDSASRINNLKKQDVRNDYNKYFYTNPVTQQYAVSVRGGANNNSYTFSVNYDRNKGALYDQQNKLNINIQNVYQPHKNIQMLLGVYYTNSNSTSGRPANVQFDGKPIPYLQLANADGSAAAVPVYHTGYTDTAGMAKLLDWRYYPLEDYKHNILKTNVEDFVANIGLAYKVFAGLNFDLHYQYQRQTSNAERNADKESLYARDLINQFSQVDYSTGNIKYIVPNNAIQMRYNNLVRAQNFRAQANYNKQWGNHAVNAIAGFEAREITKDMYNTALYGYNNDPLTTANVDYINQYPTLPFARMGTVPGAPALSNYTTRFLSAYATEAYTYKRKYSLSGSLRKDGANILGVATNDKWKPLWSVGLGWEISKEGFYTSNLFTYLKLRTSCGYSGNVDATKTALPVAFYGTNPITNTRFTRITALNNPQLQWEESRQLNIAMDFSTKNGVLTGTAAFYTKKGTNLYGLANYDYTTWGYAEQITKNVASMSGKGVDIQLTTKNIDKTFKWSTQILLNYNESKVTDYYTTAAGNGSSLVGNNGTSITPAIGKPLYAIAAYKWGGLNNLGDPQGYLDGQKTTNYSSIISRTNTKGIVDNESVKFIGSAVPVIFGSVINTFSWRKFSAAVNIAYKLGYYFKKNTLSYYGLFNGGTGTNDFSRRWKLPGDEMLTDVPAMVYTNYPQFSFRESFYSNAEIHVLSGDHVRLQYINLNYSIKEASQTSKIGLRVYANISNLGILWRANKENIDPDYPYTMPVTKSYTIGVQASF